LVGVVNDTGHLITSINLSGIGIFSFDGDGVDGYTGVTNSAAGLSSQAFYTYGQGTDQYGGADAYFTNLFVGLGYLGQKSTGTVNFLNGISGNGGLDYFALEESISLNAPPPVTGTNLSPPPNRRRDFCLRRAFWDSRSSSAGNPGSRRLPNLEWQSMTIVREQSWTPGWVVWPR
jgi:hypothetical protein